MLHDPRREAAFRARVILNAAADYIEEHGWCQYALHMSGRVCLLGALHAAEGVHPGDHLFGYDPVSADVMNRLHRATGSVSLSAWNDAAGRTKEQVVKALRKAAQA